jgi:hypothetical protein
MKTPLKGAAAGKNTREAMLETSADYRPFFPAVQKGINIEENPGPTPPFTLKNS